MGPPGYAPLWCKSNFSFLEGAAHPEELVEQAHLIGLRSLALTDRDGVYGDEVVRAGVFLTNMTDFAAMNGIYGRVFSQLFPARTTIAAAVLPLGACVEIDLVVEA